MATTKANWWVLRGGSPRDYLAAPGSWYRLTTALLTWSTRSDIYRLECFLYHRPRDADEAEREHILKAARAAPTSWRGSTGPGQWRESRISAVQPRWAMRCPPSHFQPHVCSTRSFAPHVADSSVAPIQSLPYALIPLLAPTVPLRLARRLHSKLLATPPAPFHVPATRRQRPQRALAVKVSRTHSRALAEPRPAGTVAGASVLWWPS
jgi:hypothetical protein